LKTQLNLDVTSWIRGPRTSIGLCAQRLESELRHNVTLESGVSIETWTRRSPKAQDAEALYLASPETYKHTRKLGFMNAWNGVGGIYHSVDPVLSRLKNSTKVMTVHDCWTLWENSYQDPKFQKIQKRKFERSLGRADHIVVPSKHVAEQLVSRKPEFEGRVTVIPWGPHISPENLSESLKPSAVSAYLDKGRPYFLCVANLEKRKNHEILFRAMEALPQVDLVLVGSKGFGWEDVEKGRRALCMKTPCFFFEGLSSSEIATLYQRSLAVVLPSLDEGFGLPACEAMSFDKPLVLSQIPPFFEIAGSSAIYFDPKEGMLDLRQILASLASDASLRDSWASKVLMRKHLFSWQLTARAHLALYRRL